MFSIDYTQKSLESYFGHNILLSFKVFIYNMLCWFLMKHPCFRGVMYARVGSGKRGGVAVPQDCHQSTRSPILPRVGEKLRPTMELS